MLLSEQCSYRDSARFSVLGKVRYIAVYSFPGTKGRESRGLGPAGEVGGCGFCPMSKGGGLRFLSQVEG